MMCYSGSYCCIQFKILLYCFQATAETALTWLMSVIDYSSTRSPIGRHFTLNSNPWTLLPSIWNVYDLTESRKRPLNPARNSGSAADNLIARAFHGEWRSGIHEGVKTAACCWSFEHKPEIKNCPAQNTIYSGISLVHWYGIPCPF